MKLGRFSVDGEVRFGVVEDGSVVTASREDGSFGEMLEAVTVGEDVDLGGETYSLGDVEYLPPTTESNTVFAAALNYRSHVEETSMAIPERPLLFLKPYRSLIGDGTPIPLYTSITTELDYEAELAVVIGTPCWNVSESEALDYVAGYTVLNDITSRNVQRMSVGDVDRLDWFSSKALQGSTPVGPFVTTADEVSDPMDLRIRSWVNGETMQDESTGLMIRDVPELVSFAASRVELQPGDLIATGTPEGVGHWQDLDLEDGDTIEIEIDEVGSLTNTVRAVE
ncbi:fumarylacetoacetate hydrolase family protein [Natronorarus salvus]|uniref:fumarylacetoacetate hydrolase family protein n=1 Tax=Natronorarus salvus TaxID=3117733 RepID=UPI002F262158